MLWEKDREKIFDIIITDFDEFAPIFLPLFVSAFNITAFSISDAWYLAKISFGSNH